MGERTANVVPGDISVTITRLAQTIESRVGADPEVSYTARLLVAPIDDVLKKLVEESTELALAIKDDDHDHVRYEAADLVYHLLVLLQKVGISVDELAGELDARH